MGAIHDFLLKPRRMPGVRARAPSRQPNPVEVQRQWIDLMISTIFCLVGLVTAYLLSRSATVASLLGTLKLSDKHVFVSLTTGVIVAAALTVVRLWTVAKRQRKDKSDA